MLSVRAQVLQALKSYCIIVNSVYQFYQRNGFLLERLCSIDMPSLSFWRCWMHRSIIAFHHRNRNLKILERHSKAKLRAPAYSQVLRQITGIVQRADDGKLAQVRFPEGQTRQKNWNWNINQSINHRSINFISFTQQLTSVTANIIFLVIVII